MATMAKAAVERQVCAHCGRELPADPRGGVRYQIVTHLQENRIPRSDKWCEECYAEAHGVIDTKAMLAKAKAAKAEVDAIVGRSAPAAESRAEVLSSHEHEALIAHEAVIEAGLSTFIHVGGALMAIREKKLYRAAHGTFEDYCRERWGMQRANAYRLMDAATVVQNLSPIGDILPANEAQARPLTALPAEEQAAAWQEAVASAPEGKVTAAHVERTVAARRIPPVEDLLENRAKVKLPEVEAADQATSENGQKINQPAAEPETWSAGAVGLERDWSADELDEYTEAAEGGRPWDQKAEVAPRTKFDQAAFDRWLEAQGDAQAQRAVARSVAFLGVHADCWPDLWAAIPAGMGLVPNDLKQMGKMALERLQGKPGVSGDVEYVAPAVGVASPQADPKFVPVVAVAPMAPRPPREDEEELLTITMSRRLMAALRAYVTWRQLPSKRDRDDWMVLLDRALKQTPAES